MALSHTPHTVSVIDNSEANESELKENEELLRYMRSQNLYESEEEFQHRVDVLQLLLELVPKWVQLVAKHLGMSNSDIAEATGAVFSYGSFRLSTHGPGDDIDTLCVGPMWCERERHFFGHEPYCLEEILRRCNWVTKVQAVPEAFVPVLKLEIRGIDIDLPYAQLPLNELPSEIDLQDNNLLRNMDAASVTSINGCRVTDKIVQLNTVNGEYRQAFQDALRFLKLWAKRRGIYSNVMGFLGGVNFAILTTRTCLHYPNACASTIVRNFFRLFAAWDWAGAVPVMVAGIDRGGPASDMVWDPTISMHQGREIFPIITPCYPASNSTFNVSDCTKSILISEFERGRDIVNKYPLKSNSNGSKFQCLNFEELAAPVNFLGPGSFANYLQVIAAASSNEDFAKWSGYLNARVKHFVSRLHNTQGMLRARPWPKDFVIPMCVVLEECDDGRQRTSWLIGLIKTPSNGGTRRIDIRSTIQDFKVKCEAWHGHSPGMTLEIRHLKFDSLPEYLAVHGREVVTIDDYTIPAVHADGNVEDLGHPTVVDPPEQTSQVSESRDAARECEAKPEGKSAGQASQFSNENVVNSDDTSNEAVKQSSSQPCGEPFTVTEDTSEQKLSAGGGSTSSSPFGSKRKRDEPEPEREGAQRLHAQEVTV